MKQILSLMFLLSLGAVTVSALSIPMDTEEHPKLQFYKDSNYTLQQIMEDLAKDHNKSDPNQIKRTKRSICYATQLYGGNGGRYFDDNCKERISQIEIHENNRVIRSFRATYRSNDGHTITATQRGSPAGDEHRIHFGHGEQIIAVLVRAGEHRVHQLAFLTEIPTPGGSGTISGHVFGPYGPERGELYIVNKRVISFFGRAGSEIDAIGFRFIH